MFDYCFAGRDFAAEDAIVIHEDEEAQAEAWGCSKRLGDDGRDAAHGSLT